MNKSITAIVTATVTVAFLALALPAISQAQDVNDHLKCYKINDEHKYSARADLLTNEEQLMYPDERCRIKVRSKEFCLPVTKDRQLQLNNPHDAPHEDVIGQDLTNDFLCYKVRCKNLAGENPPEVQEVVDQFGQRKIGGFRTTKICTPAWKIFDPVLCEDVSGPTCNGDCPDATDQCEPIAGTSSCECTPIPTLCEDASGPTCNGDCPNATDQCESIAGTSSCKCTPIPTLCEDASGPTCNGDCPNPTDECGVGASGSCMCTPIIVIGPGCGLSFNKCFGVCKDSTQKCTTITMNDETTCQCL
jgi:hypothetical protein